MSAVSGLVAGSKVSEALDLRPVPLFLVALVAPPRPRPRPRLEVVGVEDVAPRPPLPPRPLPRELDGAKPESRGCCGAGMAIWWTVSCVRSILWMGLMASALACVGGGE